MRHHTQTIVGPDLDGTIEPPKPTHTPALRHLAQKCYEGFHNGKVPENWPHYTESFFGAAQAVRLAELEEQFTDEDHYEASKVFASTGYMAASGSILKSALSAALASRLARARKENP